MLFRSLTGANLTNTNLSNANLTDAVLTGANLSGVDLSGATLNGVVSRGITGTPKSLPPLWKVSRGYLIGPRANLTGATLSGVDVTDVSLRYAQLDGVASGGIVGDNVILPDGWRLANGYLVGSTAVLVRANLSGADLAGAKVKEANLLEIGRAHV